MTPFKLDETFQFKAGPVHRVVEVSEAPITPCDLREGYMQSRCTEVHLKNQNVSKIVGSTMLPCKPPQTSEHGNKKLKTMRLTRDKKASSSIGTKALKCSNLDPDFNIKSFNPIQPSDHNHGFPLPLSPSSSHIGLGNLAQEQGFSHRTR